MDYFCAEISQNAVAYSSKFLCSRKFCESVENQANVNFCCKKFAIAHAKPTHTHRKSADRSKFLGKNILWLDV